MRLGKVLGTVVASQKQPMLEGFKLLIVADIDNQGNVLDTTLVAADTVGAGVGEVVLYTSGSSSRFTEHSHDAPIDHVIVGIVDLMDVGGKVAYDKQGDK